MATFTSATSGDWNASATWGKAGDPPVKGTDYPGLAGDVVNIGTTAGQSHTVVYNVSETNELGAMAIGNTTSGTSILSFKTDTNTKITLGHVDITVNAGSELRVGNEAAPIGAAYTAELVWNTTSDNAKGINLASSTSKLSICGDPAYYGSRMLAQLKAAAGTTQTIGTTGGTVNLTINDPTATNNDYSTDWKIGQLVLVHKGGAFAHITNDFCILTITGLSYSGGLTTLSCNITHNPGGSASYNDTGYVLLVSRNVELRKSGITADLSQTVTNRPRVIAQYGGPPNQSYIRFKDVKFNGLYRAYQNGWFYAENIVAANCNSAFDSQTLGDSINTILYSMGSSALNSSFLRFTGYICNSYGFNNNANLYNSNNELMEIYGVTYGVGFMLELNFTANIFSCQYAIGV